MNRNMFNIKHESGGNKANLTLKHSFAFRAPQVNIQARTCILKPEQVAQNIKYTIQIQKNKPQVEETKNEEYDYDCETYQYGTGEHYCYQSSQVSEISSSCQEVSDKEDREIEEDFCTEKIDLGEFDSLNDAKEKEGSEDQNQSQQFETEIYGQLNSEFLSQLSESQRNTGYQSEYDDNHQTSTIRDFQEQQSEGRQEDQDLYKSYHSSSPSQFEIQEDLSFSFNVGINMDVDAEQKENEDIDELVNPEDLEIEEFSNASSEEESELEGLKVYEIEQFPERLFISIQGREKSGKCAICIESYLHQEYVRTLPCLHQFHSECIQSWLLKQPNCPLCKTDLRPYKL